MRSEVIQRVEPQGPVEFLLVDPMGSLDFPVVLRGPWAYEFVRYAVVEEESLEMVRANPAKRREAIALNARPVRELEAVVGLDDFGRVPEEGDCPLHSLDRLVHRVLVRVIEEPFPGRLVQV